MKEYIVEKKQTSGGWTWAEPKGELIRCKDCLWHYGTICRRNNTMFWNDDDFCSHAEREEYETD